MQGWKLRDMDSKAEKCGAEIVAQASMDSQNHIYCNWRSSNSNVKTMYEYLYSEN